jgi:hypothetical protein
VDFAYLEDFAAGDKTVVREVLTLFRQQAEAGRRASIRRSRLARRGPHDQGRRPRRRRQRAGRHLCEGGGRGRAGLTAVKAALDSAVADIAAYQARA